MPAVSSSDQVVHEDLSDALILSDVRNTPVTSRMRKGERLKAMLFSWPVERLGVRRSGGIPENKDVDAFEGDTRARLYGRAERFWRTPRVTVIAQKVNDAAGVHQEGEYNKQVTKKTKDQKRDIEWETVSDQESFADDGVTGDKFRGLGRVINDGTLAFSDTPTAIPATFRTPTGQIYTGTKANFDEAQMNLLMQKRFDLLGATSEFTLFAASGLKSWISTNFGKYVPNKTGYTVAVRTQTGPPIDAQKLIASGIDVYEGDFGTFSIELASFMPTDLRGYGLDMEQLQMRPLMYCDLSPLPYQGGGLSGLIDSILGYEYGDPRAHFKIAPSDESAVTAAADGN